ncbi:MAG: DUF2325 domain-containing protein [Nitrosomonas sp.]|nr:DUF2325 domain-containing protein [Nitrosomonas sp.]MBA3971692.1 DUF2325 domain-containing protein [Bacteroidota bacterium]
MKLLKKTPFAIIATSLIPPTTQNIENLFTCKQYIKGIFHKLLSYILINKFNIKQLYSAQSWQLFVIKLMSEVGLLKFLLKYPKNKITREKTETINNQAPLTDHYYQMQQVNTSSTTTPNRDWTPLIKVNTADHFTQKNRQYNPNSNNKVFAGKFILCVGGRSALYPEYHRLIATLGGSFLIYRGSLESNINRLYLLLEKADMIICPVDCVNHNDFYTVKFYCKFSGKPHTLLDRSNLATFNKGVHILAKFACQYSCLQNSYNQTASIYQS